MIITIAYTSLIILLGLATDMRKTKARNRYILLCTLLLAFLSGFRSIMVGTSDTQVYLQSFADCVNMSYQQIAENFTKDIFYYQFNHFIATLFGDNFHMLLLVIALLYMASLAYLLKKESGNPLVSFIVFLAMGYFSFQMNGVRQGLAMAFVMLAYIPLKHRKLIQFLALVFCAYLFHSTSLIFLLAYPLSYLSLKKRAIFVYAAVVIICLIYGQSIMDLVVDEAANYDARFEGYQIYQAKLTYSGLIQLILFATFSFSYYGTVVKKDPTAQYLYTMLLLSIIFQSMAVFIAEMFRVAMYFNIFLILLLPKVFEAIPKQQRGLYSVGLCGLLLIYFFFFGAGTHPYYFYWND